MIQETKMSGHWHGAYSDTRSRFLNNVFRDIDVCLDYHCFSLFKRYHCSTGSLYAKMILQGSSWLKWLIEAVISGKKIVLPVTLLLIKKGHCLVLLRSYEHPWSSQQVQEMAYSGCPWSCANSSDGNAVVPWWTTPSNHREGRGSSQEEAS